MRKNTTPIISKRSKIMYGSGDLGLSMVLNSIGGFIMFFGTVVCGMPGFLMGLAIALTTVWDAVTDPVMGYLTDKTNSRFFGKRHGYILIGILGISIFNILLWSIPVDAGIAAKFFWFLLGIMILNVFITFYMTPNGALSVELSSDYTERTQISSIKSVFMLIGTIAPVILMIFLQAGTAVFPDGRFNPASYLNLAYISSVIVLIFGFITFITSYTHIPRLRGKAMGQKNDGEKKTLKNILSNFFKTFKNPLYKNLVLGFSITMMASAFLTTAGFHMFTFSFRLAAIEMYLLMAALFIMTIISQPFWIWFVGRYDKKTAILAGIFSALSGVVYIGLIFVLRNEIPNLTVTLLPGLIFAGAGMGALYPLPWAMLGDANDIEKSETKEDRTGATAGFMTFSNKIAMAATQLFVGVMLSLIGFRSETVDADGNIIPVTDQPPLVQWGLGILVIFGVIATLVAGFIFYSRYSVTKEDILKLAPADEEEKPVIIEQPSSKPEKNIIKKIFKK